MDTVEIKLNFQNHDNIATSAFLGTGPKGNSMHIPHLLWAQIIEDNLDEQASVTSMTMKILNPLRL